MLGRLMMKNKAMAEAEEEVVEEMELGSMRWWIGIRRPPQEIRDSAY
jgi:hypothetical protein